MIQLEAIHRLGDLPKQFGIYPNQKPHRSGSLGFVAGREVDYSQGGT